MASTFQDPDGANAEPVAMTYDPGPAEGGDPGVTLVRDRHEQRLMEIGGVLGVAVGRGAIGEDALVVYIRDASVGARVPRKLEGYPVETIVTGEIDASAENRWTGRATLRQPGD